MENNYMIKDSINNATNKSPQDVSKENELNIATKSSDGESIKSESEQSVLLFGQKRLYCDYL